MGTSWGYQNVGIQCVMDLTMSNQVVIKHWHWKILELYKWRVIAGIFFEVKGGCSIATEVAMENNLFGSMNFLLNTC